MKMMMTKIMIIMITLVPFLKNPMTMGIILLIQTTLMTMLMNKMMLTSWFSMITFLMMVGGLLILFTYMSSIASNEKFKFKLNLTLTIIIMIIVMDELLNENQANENQSFMMKTTETTSMIKLYNKKSMIITMMLVLYLMLTMIIISKIVKHHEGPLRSKT
uniref:NADH dehydrogenase subunit 6 n=1 Tax=Seasogonia rosea TaxID=3004257 RepID=A0A9E9FSW7_9HEMI|nr:NADH dehydrogenase subunit 6 [Seasogonia rosea]WAP91746.1 NADH dehydrogenase subunit 6 [Seasogonia rosea]